MGGIINWKSVRVYSGLCINISKLSAAFLDVVRLFASYHCTFWIVEIVAGTIAHVETLLLV